MAKVELKKLFKTYNKKIKALEDINPVSYTHLRAHET